MYAESLARAKLGPSIYQKRHTKRDHAVRWKVRMFVLLTVNLPEWQVPNSYYNCTRLQS